jgi:hypothetical protein
VTLNAEYYNTVFFYMCVMSIQSVGLYVFGTLYLLHTIAIHPNGFAAMIYLSSVKYLVAYRPLQMCRSVVTLSHTAVTLLQSDVMFLILNAYSPFSYVHLGVTLTLK